MFSHLPNFFRRKNYLLFFVKQWYCQIGPFACCGKSLNVHHLVGTGIFHNAVIDGLNIALGINFLLVDFLDYKAV